MQREQLFDDRSPPYQQYENMKRLRAILMQWRLIRPMKRPNESWRQFRERSKRKPRTEARGSR